MSSETTNVPQPPKQPAYDQPANPVSRTPAEHRAGMQTQEIFASGTDGYWRRGDAPREIRRTADSQPSSDENRARLKDLRKKERERELSRSGDVDIGYGVKQQPAEGNIAAAVWSRDKTSRAQAGAHAGPVGSAYGPGAPGFGCERDLAAGGKNPPLVDENEGGSGSSWNRGG
jgi:hypothetical protein